jgi:hypothetical protein
MGGPILGKIPFCMQLHHLACVLEILWGLATSLFPQTHFFVVTTTISFSSYSFDNLWTFVFDLQTNLLPFQMEMEKEGNPTSAVTNIE